MTQSKALVTVVGAALGVVLAGGCSSFATESFWGPAHKLSGLGTTFAWRAGARCEPDAGRGELRDIESKIEERIEAELTAKGYLRPAQGKTDFVVCYRVGKMVTQAEVGLDTRDDAVVEVDLTDPANGGMIWRGRVRGAIDYAASPEARKGRLETAIRELMKPLPKAGAP